MKRTYKTPKAVLVDFCYDEQVVAASSGVALFGDPNHIGRCQQSSETSCVYFWNHSLQPAVCESDPRSIPGFPSFDII